MNQPFTKTHKSLTTSKGTELPLMDVKGKPYLQVAHRLVWFREEHPNWTIETDLVRIEGKVALFKANIRNEEGRLISSGYKREGENGFSDYIEKAETGAVGRALAMCGYGTQFEPAMDEGSRLADSPVDQPKLHGSSNLPPRGPEVS